MTEPSFELLEEKLAIDRNNLSDEVLQYAQLFYHVSVGLVEASTRVDKAKTDLEEIESELGQEAIENLSGRVTEAIKKDYIRSKRKWKTKKDIYLQVKEIHAMWNALAEAWKQKSYQLRVLADLAIHELESSDVGTGTRSARRAIRRESRKR